MLSPRKRGKIWARSPKWWPLVKFSSSNNNNSYPQSPRHKATFKLFAPYSNTTKTPINMLIATVLAASRSKWLTASVLQWTNLVERVGRIPAYYKPCTNNKNFNNKCNKLLHSNNKIRNRRQAAQLKTTLKRRGPPGSTLPSLPVVTSSTSSSMARMEVSKLNISNNRGEESSRLLRTRLLRSYPHTIRSSSIRGQLPPRKVRIDPTWCS